MWTWCCYDDGDGIDLWQQWYDAVDDSVRGKHDHVLDFLECRGNEQWGGKHTKMLDDDIVEIRIRGDVQHRLLGFFGPHRRHFTFVLSCTHKQNVYTPAGAKKTAARRKKEIDGGNANVRVCKRPEIKED